MPIPSQTPILKTKEVEVVMIGADAYYVACRLKEAQVFAVSMTDLEYQVEKEAKPKTNPRTIILAEYHDLLDVFLDIFSKKNSDTLPLHQKYNHKIILEKEQKHNYAPLYKILLQELDAVKWYLDLHLAKRFI